MSVRELDALTLSDGRRLALCEVGVPGGPVAFYFHGTGSSRLEVALFADAATAQGARLVCWDRPGAGRSTNQPGRTLLDVVADSQSVADHLGVDSVAVAGLSGGGCHVLALAAAGGPLVNAAVTINAGAPAEDDLLALMPRQLAGFMRLARDRPRLFTVVSELNQVQGRGKFAELLEARRMRGLDPIDVDVLRRPEVRPLFEAAAKEGRRQPRAYTNEARMIWHQRWGVDLDSFPVPVHAFTGDADPFRPFAERLEEAGAKLHVFRGGHLSAFIPEVMNQVIALLGAPVP